VLGLDESHLSDVDGQRLQAPVGSAFQRLSADAKDAGFDLRIASAYRSFARQLTLWNGKLCGERPVLDDCDRPVDLAALEPRSRIDCVLRFSALPGASRHHWGTDIDVFDAGAVPEDYRLQLSLAEVSAGGPFAPLHAWLDEQIAAGRSYGFYRPYHNDRGGVAPERWHLSYAPLALPLQQALGADLLREAWHSEPLAAGLLLRDELEADLDEIVERFVMRVAPPPATALNYC
jgi:LAS superfamily LD-carboxypeptidase LdcB